MPPCRPWSAGELQACVVCVQFMFVFVRCVRVWLGPAEKLQAWRNLSAPSRAQISPDRVPGGVMRNAQIVARKPGMEVRSGAK